MYIIALALLVSLLFVQATAKGTSESPIQSKGPIIRPILEVSTNSTATYAFNPAGKTALSSVDAVQVLNYAFSKKGTIYIDSGNYNLDENLQINSETTVYAQSNVTLNFKGNSWLDLTGDDITVYGLRIIGDSQSSNFGIHAQGNSIYVENCVVNNIGKSGAFGFGIAYDNGCINGVIAGNTVQNTGLDGIHIRKNSNTTISGNEVLNSNDDGIASIWGNNNAITGNFVDRSQSANSGNGIYIADVGTIVQGNTVQNTPLNGIIVESFQGIQSAQDKLLNNTIINPGRIQGTLPISGILLNYACNCQIIQNKIDGALYDGIRVFNGSNNQISENTIMHNHRATDGWGGCVVLEYKSVQNTVFNNHIQAMEYTVAETGFGVDYNQITVFADEAAGVHVEGAHTTLQITS